MADEKADAKGGDKGEKGKDVKKKSPMMLIAVMAGVLVLLLGGSFFLVTKLTAQPAAEAGDGEGKKEHKKGGKEAKVEKYEVKDLVLNTGDGTSTRFVKISLALEIDDAKLAKELEEKEYRVRDLLINLVGHRTAAELASAEVREELRSQILDELNSTIGDGHITEIFFSDFIIQ